MERDFIDYDHLLWTKPQWEHSKASKALRRHPALIRPLDRLVHEEKHRETPPVPLLGHYAITRTLSTFKGGHTPLQSIDSLQISIEEASRNPKAHVIEKHLAELVIWTLDLAKPYWATSPDEPQRTVVDLGQHRQQRNETKT